MDDFANSEEEGASGTADQGENYLGLEVDFASTAGQIVGETIDPKPDYDMAERSDEPPSVDSLW